MKFAIETNLEEARSMTEPPRNYILITIVGVHLVCLILIAITVIINWNSPNNRLVGVDHFFKLVSQVR